MICGNFYLLIYNLVNNIVAYHVQFVIMCIYINVCSEQPLSDSDEDVYDLRNLRMSWNQSYETQTYTNYECAFVRRETVSYRISLC